MVTVLLRFPWEDEFRAHDAELIDVEAGGIWWRREPDGVACFTPWQWITEMRYPRDEQQDAAGAADGEGDDAPRP